jgi:FtsH ternary system domain X7
MSLEHVAQGQSRFMTPGVAPDPRGVLLGRYGVLLFPTLEGVVSWFRMYSSEASLDELTSGLAIQRVRTPLASRELVVRVPAVSSYTVDRAARLARLVGGSTFTGTAKHFVKYRDDRSPYGYDAVDVGAMPAGADFVLHGDDLSQSYALEGEIPLARLVFRLSVRQVPGARRLSLEDRAELLLAVQRGLGDGIIRYLWRNRVDAEVGLVSPRSDSAFEEQGRSYLLFRVRNLPDRILELFLGTPGVDVFRPVSAATAVAVGWAHPIDLSSCGSIFAADTFHLFWPGDRVDALPGPLQLSRIADLTRIDLEVEKPTEPFPQSQRAPDPVSVPLRLAPSLGPPRRVTGALIPLAQAAWLKRLVFLLPPASLRGHRIAVTDRGIVVVGSEGVDVIPLGQLLCELAPGLLVPLGMDVVPRVSPDVLERSLGHAAGVLTVLPAGGRPFQVAETALVPLERRAIAKIEVERATTTDVSADAVGDPDLVNDPVGRFALWGFPTPPDTKLLPPGE